jgi:hypothetical protein
LPSTTKAKVEAASRRLPLRISKVEAASRRLIFRPSNLPPFHPRTPSPLPIPSGRMPLPPSPPTRLHLAGAWQHFERQFITD